MAVVDFAVLFTGAFSFTLASVVAFAAAPVLALEAGFLAAEAVLDAAFAEVLAADFTAALAVAFAAGLASAFAGAFAAGFASAFAGAFAVDLADGFGSAFAFAFALVAGPVEVSALARVDFTGAAVSALAESAVLAEVAFLEVLPVAALVLTDLVARAVVFAAGCSFFALFSDRALPSSSKVTRRGPV